MKILLYTLFFISLFIISGCSTSSQINANYKFEQGSQGLIYGSVFTEDGFDADLYLYRKGEDKLFGYFAAVDSLRYRDFDIEGKMGSLFAVAAPTGIYEIRGFRNSHKLTKTVFHDARPKTKRILSFKITSRSPTYIGSYSISGFDRGKLKISNEIDRDKRYLLKTHANLGTSKSVNLTPKLKIWE